MGLSGAKDRFSRCVLLEGQRWVEGYWEHFIAQVVRPSLTLVLQLA
jgi:hypothetical protein